MQTSFTAEQLADPHVAESEKILRKCVHCGFCTATCPTYLTLGDELDSPRGRIYLIKDMLENGRPADEKLVRHIDRCLSCLACMTTCPSGVNYMHLVDHARAHIEQTYRRPFADRFWRGVLAFVLPHPTRFRMALGLAKLGKPFAPLMARFDALKPAVAMLALAPSRLPKAQVAQARPSGKPRGRVAILKGCAQPVLAPSIDAAARELLARFGIEIVDAPGEACCGALVHHMGREEQALAAARNNVDAWSRLIDDGGLDAILITTSGCGTTIKDYGFMLRLDAAYAERAAKVSALAKDVTQYLATLELPASKVGEGLRLAYHSACSLQHGQRVTHEPKRLLADAGFTVLDVPEGHLCCGSAGTYNILQSEISARLKERKLANIARTKPDLIAAGNIGCMTQIGADAGVPVVHTVELINWAHGGRRPEAIAADR